MWGNQFNQVDPDIRFLAKVRIGEPDECWPWTGCIDKQTGYGVFSIGTRNQPAHRYAYVRAKGEIPEGLTIDHTCHTEDETCPGGKCAHRICMNPDHLEPVPRGVNTLQGRTITAANRNKTHCLEGHEFTPENTYLYRGKRCCRRCHAIRQAKRSSN